MIVTPQQRVRQIAWALAGYDPRRGEAWGEGQIRKVAILLCEGLEEFVPQAVKDRQVGGNPPVVLKKAMRTQARK